MRDPRSEGLMMKTLILDHPLRHILQNWACSIPGAAFLQRARATTGAMNDPSVMAEWASLIATDLAAEGRRVEDTRFVEVGPGHSMGVAFGLLAAGAKEVYAVDVHEYADLANTDAFNNVIEECVKCGLAPTHMRGLAGTVGSRVSYRIVDHNGNWPIESASVDVVYSYFAGEHLRRPAEVVRETRRVLRPNGLCIYAIDLEDHLHRADNWLQFLYYKEWLWETMTSRRGHWTNRLRAPEWRALFEKHFGQVRMRETIRPIPPHFDVHRIASHFPHYDANTLSIASLWVVARV
jgi:SAM-dependent methyltransferase